MIVKGLENACAVDKIVLKVAIINISICEIKESMACLEIIEELAIVLVAGAFVIVDSPSAHLVLVELAIIEVSRVEIQDASPLTEILLEFALVDVAIHITVFALPLPYSLEPLALVLLATLLVNVRALSVSHSAFPLSSMDVPVHVVVLALALLHIRNQLTLVSFSFVQKYVHSESLEVVLYIINIPYILYQIYISSHFISSNIYNHHKLQLLTPS